MIIDDLTISLLSLAGIRFVGVIIFALLFSLHKKMHYLLTLLGWLFYFAGPMVELLKNNPNRTILDPLFGFSAAFATLMIILGLFSFFKKMKKSFYISIISASLITLLILYFTAKELIGLAATSMQAIFLLGLLLMIIFDRRLIRRGKAGISFFWLCITLGIGVFHSAGFLFFFGSQPLSVKFVVTAMINISLLIFFMYLDWEQIQKRYEDALKERSVLLQEIHHRVKNNLMVITSLLRLQSETVPSGQREFLVNIENRINTMALVHEQLYKSGNFKNISLGDYVSELIEAISLSYEDVLCPIRIHKQIQAVMVNINILVPIGMLINEIVTNAYKHAFKDIECPELCIDISVNDARELILSISDNGVGIEEDFVINRESTGFAIIDALKEQLMARINIRSENGLEYTIIIPEVLKGKK